MRVNVLLMALLATLIAVRTANAEIVAADTFSRDGGYRANDPSGLAPGAYRVRISAGDPATIDPNAPGDQHARVEYVPLLPPSWNTQSKLSVDVRPGRNMFHFRGTRGEKPRVEAP